MPLTTAQKNRLLEKWQKQDNADVAEAYIALMTTEKGRKLLWRLLEYGKVGQQPFSPNALNTAFACGELNVGQRILADLTTVDPASYVRMQQEQANVRDSRDRALNGRTEPSTDAGADTELDNNTED